MAGGAFKPKQQANTTETVMPEVNRIKDRLLSCTTPEELERVASEERAQVQKWGLAAKETLERTMFYQIRNLKVYVLRDIEEKRAND